MGVLSGVGGDDALQVRIGVFCIVVSLMMTVMLPVMMPEWDATDADTLSNSRMTMENFTGESMLSYSPWYLGFVATPYTGDSQENEKSTYGWVYGDFINPYILDGTTYLAYHYEDGEKVYDTLRNVIRLDPNQKSDYPLYQTTAYVDITQWKGMEWWEEFWWEISSPFTGESHPVETVTKEMNAVNFTGYVYSFNPSYKFSTQGSSATSLNSDYGSLKIVWYDNTYGSGISGGLILYSEQDNIILANYSANDIIGSANTDSKFATRYLLDFQGVNVYMYIQFDTDVIAGGMDLATAWDQGKWSIGFASPSADGLMDIFNANNLSSSVGSLIDTYISIFTFDMPNVPTAYQVVFWVLCVIPMEISLLMFLSRFGVFGVAGGVIASALAFVGL